MFEIPFFEKTIGLRKSGITFGFTDNEVNGNELEEYTKCKIDINYFANNYCFIKSEDGAFHKMTLRDYQYDILDLYDNNKLSILMASRQVGKTIIASIYILHYMLFNDTKSVLIAANVLDTSKEVLDKKLKQFIHIYHSFYNKELMYGMYLKSNLKNGCRAKAFCDDKECIDW